MRHAHWKDINGDDPESYRSINPGSLDLGPLFERAPSFRCGPLVRRTDPPTSILAAESVAEHLTALQNAVLDAYRRHGPMTAKQAEQLPEFGHLGPSTVRKRICECARLGELETTGAIVDRCAVYRATGEPT